jgi:hypothetical protein
MGWTLGSAPALGQNVPAHNLDSFEPLDLPDPNVYRNADGRPGDAYWQNAADYQIDVRLDTASNTLTGQQSITYTNNAPQSLDRLWVQLEQNYFRPDSRGARVVPPDARFSGFFEGAGYDISKVQLKRNGETVTPTYDVRGTRMLVELDEPLAAEGGTLTLSLQFAFTIPEYGADRHGRLDVEQGTVYQLAQWYPRMYVYDDVHGWNALPYLGQGEYYLEFGTFEVNVTVPRSHVVAATGKLQNPQEVLTETQRERLQAARTSRETVDIISRSEVGSDATRPDGEGPLTWRFKAESVRDFSWASSQAFIWDAANADVPGRSVLAQSFYPKEGIGSDRNPGWERSTDFVQHSVEFYSEWYAPYPYPNAINVAGVVGGMEYPQIMFCDYQARGRGLFGVTDHEFGHTWFPMVVGSDERRWVWMDEGMNSFMNVYSRLAFYGEGDGFGDAATTRALQRLSRRTASVMRSPLGNQPVMTYADHMRDDALGFLAYRKPANGLMLLREYVVGPERFDAAFQAYIDRWKYKHPKPADFFRTIEEVTGEDLDWFWRSWFYETDVVDHAVDTVETESDAPTRVVVAQKGELMLPITAQLTFADGSTDTHRVPAEAFFTQDTHPISVPQERTLERVTLDPDRILPDVNRQNNSWSASNASGDASSGDASSGNSPR